MYIYSFAILADNRAKKNMPYIRITITDTLYEFLILKVTFETLLCSGRITMDLVACTTKDTQIFD